MTLEQKKDLFKHFAQYITPERAQTILRCAHERTRYVTVVLEDISHSHNASAALRSCDCFGIQDVHMIEMRHTFVENTNISKGANKWLSIHRYNQPKINNTQICYEALKKQNYTIIATTPHTNDVMIDKLPLNNKIALVFGTEEKGLSSYALEQADGYAKIPMYGFTQSFNISVSVALSVYETTKRLRESNYNWRLTPEEVVDLQLDWLGRATYRTEEIQRLIAL